MKADRGLYIAFEGIDGCGKSTQAAKFKDYLERTGNEVVFVREPGDTKVGDQCRKILLGSESMDSITEMLLFYAARREGLQQIIRPALNRGAYVVSDRCFFSTIAYQGYGRGLSLAVIDSLTKIVCGGLLPDFTFILDLKNPTETLHDAKRPQDRIERESGLRFAAAEGYKAIARSFDYCERLRLIQANSPQDYVAATIVSIFQHETRRGILATARLAV